MRATESERKPTAVTRLVIPQAAPTRPTAEALAVRGSTPRRVLRRMSSIKWIESQVPTTIASDGTMQVSMLIGTSNKASRPVAHSAPTMGGRLASSVDASASGCI